MHVYLGPGQVVPEAGVTVSVSAGVVPRTECDGPASGIKLVPRTRLAVPLLVWVAVEKQCSHVFPWGLGLSLGTFSSSRAGVTWDRTGPGAGGV